MEHKYIAKTFAGLENVLAQELTNIGAEKVRVLKRAVEFFGDKKLMYKANYLCRTALRILKPIAEFEAFNEDQLYDEVKKINWEEYLSLNKTFAIDGITNQSNIDHSKYLALKTKDAIADFFREKYDKRPNVSTRNPDLSLNVRIFKNRCTVSTDSSGESLHKRGYRVATGLAPMNEVLAAGLILLSGWDKKSNFIDPMCGSGTIPIEAAMYALNIPAGYFKEDYIFKQWNDFDKELWEEVKEEAFANRTEFKHSIIASDWSGRVMSVANENFISADVASLITQKTTFFEDLVPPENGGVLIMNPPYGQRMKVNDIYDFYKKIGDKLKKDFNGYEAWIISADLKAIKNVGLKPDQKIQLYNGPLESSFYKFSIYEGTRKETSFNWEDDEKPLPFKDRERKREFPSDRDKKPFSGDRSNRHSRDSQVEKRRRPERKDFKEKSDSGRDWKKDLPEIKEKKHTGPKSDDRIRDLNEERRRRPAKEGATKKVPSEKDWTKKHADKKEKKRPARPRLNKTKKDLDKNKNDNPSKEDKKGKDHSE
jgi:putative N6-adenine-specific DNA methylase